MIDSTGYQKLLDKFFLNLIEISLFAIGILVIVFVLLFLIKKIIANKRSIRSINNTDEENEDFWNVSDIYIDKLLYYEELIKNYELREKLQNIANISQTLILKYKGSIETNKKVKKYFTYYLFEIYKLVEKYVEIEKISNKTENMIQAQQKIFITIDYAEKCFEKFLMESFDNIITEINVDTQVLNQMLNRL